MLNANSFHFEPPIFESPKYDEDCDMLEICESIGATYNVCYKGCDIMGCDRCSIDTRQNILQQHNSQKLAEQNAKMQEKENKKSAFRSWVQLILAALLGGVFTKLLDWLFELIQQLFL